MCLLHLCRLIENIKEHKVNTTPLTSTEIYNHYLFYCLLRNIRAVRQALFGTLLVKLFPETKIYRGPHQYTYGGIKLLSDVGDDSYHRFEVPPGCVVRSNGNETTVHVPTGYYRNGQCIYVIYTVNSDGMVQMKALDKEFNPTDYGFKATCDCSQEAINILVKQTRMIRLCIGYPDERLLPKKLRLNSMVMSTWKLPNGVECKSYNYQNCCIILGCLSIGNVCRTCICNMKPLLRKSCSNDSSCEGIKNCLQECKKHKRNGNNSLGIVNGKESGIDFEVAFVASEEFLAITSQHLPSQAPITTENNIDITESFVEQCDTFNNSESSLCQTVRTVSGRQENTTKYRFHRPEFTSMHAYFLTSSLYAVSHS